MQMLNVSSRASVAAKATKRSGTTVSPFFPSLSPLRRREGRGHLRPRPLHPPRPRSLPGEIRPRPCRAGADSSSHPGPRKAPHRPTAHPPKLNDPNRTKNPRPKNPTTPKRQTKQATKRGPVGFRRNVDSDLLWLPNTTRPEWLDGSLPGDRGFDPLGLSRPAEFAQIGVDENDINAAKNFKGNVETFGTAAADEVSATRLAPYSEVFGLQRFRECELIHGRWAMLATLGCLVAESSTGVSWIDAGKVELDGASYLGLPLPFSISQLCWIEALLVGGAEVYRNTELDPELRLYPGGAFDPLNLAGTGDAERTFKLRTAEIKHARLAMVGFLGYAAQAAVQGEGVVGSLAKFTEGFSK